MDMKKVVQKASPEMMARAKAAAMGGAARKIATVLGSSVVRPTKASVGEAFKVQRPDAFIGKAQASKMKNLDQMAGVKGKKMSY